MNNWKLNGYLYLVPWFLLVTSILVSAQDPCPKIAISGPAGSTMAGDSMIFAVSVDVRDYDKLFYRWRSSAGTIEEGQGKPWIVVRTEKEGDAVKIVASVEIIGLPDGCLNKAMEEGPVVYPSHPPELAEIEVFTGPRFRSKLDAVAKELANHPDSLLYLLSYREPDESEALVARRETLMKDYFTKIHKIDKKRLVFVKAGVRSRLVKIYLIPPARKAK